MLRIIVLEEEKTNPAPLAFRFAIWADVPAARQGMAANADFTSAYKNVSAGDLASLRSGAVVEKVEIAQYPAGTGTAAIAADLQAKALTFQTQVNAFNPWSRYGTVLTYNGSTWSNTPGGVA